VTSTSGYSTAQHAWRRRRRHRCDRRARRSGCARLLDARRASGHACCVHCFEHHGAKSAAVCIAERD